MKLGTRVHYTIVIMRRFITNETRRKRLNQLFAGLITLITIFSVIPLIVDNWRPILEKFFSKAIGAFPSFAAFFYDPRAFILYLVILLFWLSKVYHKHESRFLQLALQSKRELAADLPLILNGRPNNHYLGLIIGKFGEDALRIKERRGAQILSSIDKNIKKHERVYWISGDEIGIVIYEADEKDETDFINIVLRRKLTAELGVEDSKRFLDSITFAMVKINAGEELYEIESRAKSKLLLKMQEKDVVINAGKKLQTGQTTVKQ